MKYFAIQSCLNEKIIGKYPQVKEFIHHCNVEEESNFIDKFIFEKIKTQPILSIYQMLFYILILYKLTLLMFSAMWVLHLVI